MSSDYQHKSVPETENEALREENEVLKALLNAALKQLASIEFQASSEAVGIQKCLDEL